ncbi:hypothetical protein GW17_00061261, partial [Ensete ventricosum]
RRGMDVGRRRRRKEGGRGLAEEVAVVEGRGGGRGKGEKEEEEEAREAEPSGGGDEATEDVDSGPDENARGGAEGGVCLAVRLLRRRLLHCPTSTLCLPPIYSAASSPIMNRDQRDRVLLESKAEEGRGGADGRKESGGGSG